MPTQVQFRRGNTSQHSTFTGAEGELTVDTQKDTLVVHDGTTAGGFPVVTALAKESIIPSTNGTFSLGNTTNRWANLFLSGNTLVIGDQSISSNSTGFNLSGTIFVSNTEVLSSSEITVTTGITVGNSTVNTSISPTTIVTTGTMTVGNTSVNGTLATDNVTVTGFANVTSSLQVAGDASFGANVTIAGDLVVSGNVTQIATTELDIEDNIIVLNFGLPAESAPSLDAGFQINRGSSANVSFLWDETGDYWDIGNTAVTGFINVSSTGQFGGNVTITGTTNTSVALNVGANVNLDTTRINVGNSSVNTFITSDTITTDGTLDVLDTATLRNTLAAGNTTVTGFANISSTLDSGNTTVTGFINVSSTAEIGGVLSARANVVANGQLIVANTVSLGNTTITGFANVSSSLASGNATVTGFANISSTLDSGNTTITGFINVSTTGQFGGNVTVTGTTNTSVALNVGANVNLSTSTINVGNSTVNSTITQSVLTIANVVATNLSGNGSAITSLDANSVATGTLNTDRLPATANISTAINVGANVNLTTSTISIGNNSVNSSISSGQLLISNVTATNISGNGASVTSVDAATVGSNTASDLQNHAANLASNAFSNATAFAANADNIASGTLNTDRLPATANISTAINVGSNVSLNVSTIKVGSATLDDSTLTVSNVSATNISGNGSAITSLDANSITTGTLNEARLPNTAVVANTYGNSSQIPVFTVDATGRLTAANTVAVAGVSNVVYTEANTSLVLSTGDGSSFTVNFGTANSSFNGLIKVVDSTSNTAANIAASANSVKVAFDAAGNSFSNATAFAANADNIASGTLNTDRLPATVNVATQINVGANVIANTTTLKVGNGTTNTIIQKNSINIGNSTVNSSITQSVLTIANVVATNITIDTASLGNTTITGFANVVGNLQISDTVTANNLSLTGNLTVSGTTTFIDSITLNIGDNIITLNADVTGATAPTENAGLEINRGSSANVNFLWDETGDYWDIGNTFVTGVLDVSSTANIGGVLSARANVVANGQLIVANVVSLGNTTITGFANISSTLASGNTTVTGFINVSTTGQFGGNVTVTGTTNTSVALNVGANVNLSTSTINVGNATINSVVSSSSLDLSGNRIRSLTHTSSNTDLQTFDSFTVSAFRSAQYSVQLTSGTDFHVINLSLVHDDETVFLAQYGEIFDNVSIGSFDAAIATGNVNVQFTPANAVTVLRAVATMIKV